MQLINALLVNTIILLFPIVVSMFYFAHNNNLDKERNDTFLDFSLLSSVYLFYTHCKIENAMNLIIMINIPLIIAFIKKRNFVSIIISLLIIFMYKYNSNIPILIILIEYTIYYLVYLLKKKNDILIIITIFIGKLILLLIENIIANNSFLILVYDILILISFIAITNLIIYFLKMGEDIIKLHLTIKELEQEKQIRDSLFKITHEIKNPIAVCKSYLDMFDFDNKEHKKYIPIIKEEIDKTLYLLQDFLAMNKIKIQKEILDINMLLEDVTSQFDNVMKSKNIDFQYNIEDEEIFIEGDYNRLSQVLTNIIKNSIEAIDINKSPLILLKTEISDNKFKIIIEDNGLGIADEHLKRIKEPFYTTKKNGTGLGVSLSCEIINAHGGTIDFKSLQFEWTKVEINLPISNLL